MTNQEIAEFLQDFRVQLQVAMDERMRPKYKNNTWLRQTDLHPNERICMQLIDEINGPFTVSYLAELTGLSNKCIRDNFNKLIDRKLIKRADTSGFSYVAINLF